MKLKNVVLILAIATVGIAQQQPTTFQPGVSFTDGSVTALVMVTFQ
jgi:multisubunit Na+/H+ antiporter MnhB subunit